MIYVFELCARLAYHGLSYFVHEKLDLAMTGGMDIATIGPWGYDTIGKISGDILGTQHYDNQVVMEYHDHHQLDAYLDDRLKNTWTCQNDFTKHGNILVYLLSQSIEPLNIGRSAGNHCGHLPKATSILGETGLETGLSP